MATINTITDEYIIRPKIDDQAGPGVDKLTTKLVGFETQADKAAAAAANMAKIAADTGDRFSLAATKFDTYAKKYDDVTKAAAALAAAQRELQRAQEAGTAEVLKGITSQEKYDATMAGLAVSISKRAEALGIARANAEADAEAQARWNGEIGTGSVAAAAFADRITQAAEATKASQIAFSNWLNQGEQTNAGIVRFNANLGNYVAGLGRLRAEFDPVFAAEQKYADVVTRSGEAVEKAGLSEDLRTAAVSKAAAARDEAIAAINGETAALKAQTEALAAATAAQAAYAQYLDRTEAAYDPLIGAIRAYAGAETDIKALLDAGLISRARANDLLFAAAAAFDKLAASAESAAAAERDASEAGKLADALHAAPTSSAQIATNRTDATAAFGDLGAQATKIDGLAAAFADLATQQTLVNTLLAGNAISAEAAAIWMAKYQAAVDAARAAETEGMAAINGETAALKAQADALAAQTAATEAAAKAQAEYVQYLDRTETAYDPLIGAVRTFNGAMDDVGALLDANLIGQGRANDLLFAASAAYDKVAVSAEKAAAAQREAADATKLATALGAVPGGFTAPTSSAQIAANRADATAAFGDLDAQAAQIDKVAAAEQRLAVQQTLVNTLLANKIITDKAGAESIAAYQAAVDAATASTSKQAVATDDLRMKYDPLYRNSKQYETAVTEIEKAQKEQGLSSVAAEAAMASAGKVLASGAKDTDNLSASQHNATFAARQFGVQMVQMGTMIGTGSPPLLAIIQQGHQLVDVAIATGTGFGVIGDAAKRAWASVATFAVAYTGLVAAVAIVAPFVAVGLAMEVTARRLIDLQQELRSTRSDYDSLAVSILAAAKAAAANSTLSTTDARAAGQTIASQPNFAGSTAQLQALVTLAADISRAFSVTVPVAAQRLAAALADPAKAAKDLAEKQFPGMTAAIARNVELLQLQGKTVDAQNIVLDTYARGLKGAADAGTPLQKALTGLGQNLDALAHHITSFASQAIAAVVSVTDWIAKQTGSKLDQLQGPNAAPMRGSSLLPGSGDVMPVKINPDTGAAGLYQIMPQTAAGMPTLDALKPLDNITMGILDFLAKLKAASGDIDIALKNSGGFITKDPTAYIASVKSQDVSQLEKIDPSLPDAITRIATDLGVTDKKVMDILLKLPLQESTGRQFATVNTRAQAQAALDVQNKFWPNAVPQPGGMPAGQFGPAAPSAAQAGQANILQGQLNAADTAFQTQAIEAQRDVLQKTIDGWTRLRDIVGANSEAGQNYTVLIGKMTGDLVNLRTPTEAFTKSLQDQSNTSGFEAGAAKQLADAYHSLDEASIAQTGHTASLADKEAARSTIIAGLTKNLSTNADESQRQAAANQGAIPILGQGAKALDDYNAKIQAQTQALQFGERGSPAYVAAQKLLEASNIAVADSERAKTDTANLYTQTTDGQRQAIRNQITELSAQRDAVGATTDQGKLFSAQIARLGGDLVNLRTPTEAFTKSLQDQSNASGFETGAAKALADVYHTLDEASIAQTGHAASAADKEAARSLVIQGLTKDLSVNADAAQRQAAANQGAIPILGQGAKALDDYNARVAAQTQALQFGERGSQAYNVALGILTASNIAVSDSERAKTDTANLYTATTDGQRQAIRNQITELTAQRDAVGAATDQGKLFSAQIARLSGDLVNVRSPTEQFTKSLQDQVTVSGYEAGAAKQLADAFHALDEASIAETGHAASAAEKEAVRSLILQGLSKDLGVAVDAAQRQVTTNQNMVPVLERGGAALDDYNASVKAQSDALKFGARDTDAYKAALQVLTATNRDVAQSERDKTAATDVHQIQQQTEQIQQQIQLISASVDVREREIAVLQQRQKYDLQAGQQGDAEQQKAITAAAHLADLRTQLQTTQASLSYIANQFSQAFDTIGSAMTQAFITGQGQAVNWGNVMTAVAQQVLQAFLKLAVLNPLLNSLFSQHETTLGNVTDALSSTGGAAAGGGSGSNLLGTGSSLLSLGNSAYGLLGSGGAVGGGSSLVLNSATGLYSMGAPAAGSGLFGGLGSSFSGIMNTPLATGVGLNSTGFGAVTLGQALGGVGLGFTAGSLVGSGVQSLTGKVGPAPTIGAATGAIAGAIAGSFIPVIGTVLGGLLGGVVGGGGGGLIGPKAPSKYGGASLNVDDSGMLQFGIGSSQGEDNSQNVATAQANAQALDQFMQANGLRIVKAGTNSGGVFANANTPGNANPGGVQWIGTATSPNDPNFFSDIDTPNAVTGKTLTSQLQFSSSDPIMNSKLSGQTFQTTADLNNWVTAFNNAQTAAKTFLANTTAQLKDLGVTTGSLPDAINALNAAYDTDKTNIEAMIATNMLSDQQVSDLTDTENKLSDARDKAIKAAQDAANQQMFQADVALNVRQLNAQATTPGQTHDAQLYAFDAAATQQRTDFSNQMVALMGDAVKTTQAYADQMVLLDKTLAAERLQIDQNYYAQVKAAEDAIHASDSSLAGRLYTAQATVAADPVAAENAALYSFDQNAAAARTAFSKQFTDLYGDAITVTEGYANQMVLYDQTTAAERLAVIKQYNDQALALDQQAQQAELSLQARYMTAQSQNGSGAVTPEAAELFSFDQNAQSARVAFIKQLTDAYGAAFATTSAYAAQMANYDNTIAAERLVITKKYDDALVAQTKAATDQAAAAATSFIASLRQFVATLNVGQFSPLSPKAQLAYAQQTFNTTAAAAQGGDAKAMLSLQNDSQTLLTAAKAYYGSSQGYTDARDQVLSAIQGVADLPSDVLTASFLKMQLETQTDALNDELEALRNEVNAATGADQVAIAAATSAITSEAIAAQVIASGDAAALLAEAKKATAASATASANALSGAQLAADASAAAAAAIVASNQAGTQAATAAAANALAANVTASNNAAASAATALVQAQAAADKQSAAYDATKAADDKANAAVAAAQADLLAATKTGYTDTIATATSVLTATQAAAADADTNATNALAAKSLSDAALLSANAAVVAATQKAATAAALQAANALAAANKGDTNAANAAAAALTADQAAAANAVAAANAALTAQNAAAAASAKAAQTAEADAVALLTVAQQLADAANVAATNANIAAQNASKDSTAAANAVSLAIQSGTAADATAAAAALAANVDASNKAVVAAQTALDQAKAASSVTSAAYAAAQAANDKAQAAVTAASADLLAATKTGDASQIAQAQAVLTATQKAANDAATAAANALTSNNLATTAQSAAAASLLTATTKVQTATDAASTSANAIANKGDADAQAAATAALANDKAAGNAATAAAGTALSATNAASTAAKTAATSALTAQQSTTAATNTVVTSVGGVTTGVGNVATGVNNQTSQSATHAAANLNQLVALANLQTNQTSVLGQYLNLINNSLGTINAALSVVYQGVMTVNGTDAAWLSAVNSSIVGWGQNIYNATVGGYGRVTGGWIGNGIWNRDSVRASYAGGGNVMLAGGEFVMSAPAAAQYASILPRMNDGTYRFGAANDNGGGGAVLAELRALRMQSSTNNAAETRAQTATLVDEIRALRAEVSGLRNDIARSNAKPQRLSA